MESSEVLHVSENVFIFTFGQLYSSLLNKNTKLNLTKNKENVTDPKCVNGVSSSIDVCC